MNITEATKQACKEPTLLDALTWICVWESEGAVKRATSNPRYVVGWDTCFKTCLRSVIKEWRRSGGTLKRIKERCEALSLTERKMFLKELRRIEPFTRL